LLLGVPPFPQRSFAAGAAGWPPLAELTLEHGLLRSAAWQSRNIS